jgi:hypothetical protein
MAVPRLPSMRIGKALEPHGDATEQAIGNSHCAVEHRVDDLAKLAHIDLFIVLGGPSSSWVEIGEEGSIDESGRALWRKCLRFARSGVSVAFRGNFLPMILVV